MQELATVISALIALLAIVVNEWREQRKWKRVREAAALKLASPSDPATNAQDAVVSALADEENSRVHSAAMRVKSDSIKPESK